MQVQDPFTGRSRTQTVLDEVEIDEDLLRADRGPHRAASSSAPPTAASLRSVFDRIDRLEKSEIKLAAYRRYRELFPPVLLLAAALLAAAGLAWAAGLRVAPA